MTQATASQGIALAPDSVVEENGAGASVEVSPDGPRIFLLQMDILKVVDQQSLDVSVWGSADGANWGTMPLVKIPQQFYPGHTRMALDLRERPEVKFIQARWEVNRWGRGRPLPMFRFRVIAQPAA